MKSWQDLEKEKYEKEMLDQREQFDKFWDKYLRHLKHPDQTLYGGGIFAQMIKDRNKNENS